jgi:alginate O-acetyltransferase complex protein AlgJ
MQSRLARLLLLNGFGLFLILPALGMRVHFSARSDTEKRARAPMPALSWSSLGTFPKRFEEFVGDEFGFRDALVRAYSLAQIRVFHRSAVPNVIIGSDGWLFYAGYGDGTDITEFQGKAPLSEEDLAARRAELEGRAAALAAHGIRYAFVVAPNKQSVYEEELPASIGHRAPGNNLDQFGSRLGDAPLLFLDLRKALIGAKKSWRRPLYYKTDTHWNRAGAYVGYRSILAALGLPAPPAGAISFSQAPREGGDLATMLSLADAWHETEVNTTMSPREKLPLTVFVIGDSFTENLVPFLTETFARVVVSWVSDGPGFSIPDILAAKADIVVDERVERYLLYW